MKIRARCVLGPVIEVGSGIARVAGMHLHGAAEVTTGAGRAAVGDAGEVRAVTIGIIARTDAVLLHIVRVLGIGQIAPVKGMDVLLIAQLALSTCDF